MRLKSSFKRAIFSQIGGLLGDRKSAVTIFLVLVLFSIANSWLPDALSSLLSDKNRNSVMLGISGVIWLGFLASALYLASGVEFDVSEESPRKKRALILFLSDLRNEESVKEAIEGLKTGRESLENFDLNRFDRWRMPYEAIKYHLPRLESVVVITSDRSSPQFPTFKELVKTVFPKKLNVEERKLENFESVKRIFEEISSIYKSLKNRGIKERDVIIDVTSGQKTNSIAAAFMTLYYDREFQYVSTQNYKVKSYDVKPIRD